MKDLPCFWKRSAKRNRAARFRTTRHRTSGLTGTAIIYHVESKKKSKRARSALRSDMLYPGATNKPRAGDLRCERTADLPVMAKRIDHPAQAPAIRFLHREDNLGACRKCLRERRIRIGHSQDHPNRSTTQRLGTEVTMLRGLVA